MFPRASWGALVKAVNPDFNETDYGFPEFAELLNFAQDKGLVRAETSSEHGMLFYAGDDLVNRGSAGSAAAESEAGTGAVAADGVKRATRRSTKRATKGRSRTRTRRRTVTKKAAADEAELRTPDSEETGEQVAPDQEQQLGTSDDESSTPPEKQSRGRRVAGSRSSARGTRQKPVAEPAPESA